MRYTSFPPKAVHRFRSQSAGPTHRAARATRAMRRPSPPLLYLVLVGLGLGYRIDVPGCEMFNCVNGSLTLGATRCVSSADAAICAQRCCDGARNYDLQRQLL